MKHHQKTLLRQQGFTLIELAVAFFVLSAILLGITMTLNIYSKRMQVQLVGQHYQTINKAVSRYMELYQETIKLLPQDCANLSYAVGTSFASSTSIAKGLCKVNLPHAYLTGTSKPVVNGLQPTLLELKSLALVDGIMEPKLQLKTLMNVAKANASGGSSSTLAPAEYAIQIKVNCALPCLSTSPATYESMVFNTQPYIFGDIIDRKSVV